MTKNKLVLKMKIRTLVVSSVAIALLSAGCVTRVEPPPPVVAQPPPPPMAQVPPSAVVYTPEYYTWDGYEWVGVYGNQYVYWNGGAWIVCDAVILGRFHGWERSHPRWRGGAHYYRGGRYYR